MNKLTSPRKSQVFLGFVILVAALLIYGCQAEPPTPPTVSPEGLSPIRQGYFQRGLIELVPDDLPPPILPPEPVQADLGTETYYQVCLACHGNWGQGLTDEWREIGFGEDMNCWQSKCHASNHPPQGFEFPRDIPPLLGKGAMSGIANAKQLYQVIFETMPWWFPGSLSEEEALNLTAYIMRARKELPEGIVLTEANLEAFQLHVPAAVVTDDNPFGILLISGLSVAMLAYAWIQRFPDSKENK
jgi:mono/diheme cytochrome c family protein